LRYLQWRLFARNVSFESARNIASRVASPALD
jgi:hypothetical protein